MALPKITLTGNVVADPELRYTNSGTAVLNFRVAANKKGRDGGEDKTTFLTVVAWDGLAENAATQLSKGTRVSIAGELPQRDWEDKQGNKRTNYDVTAWEIALPISSFADSNDNSGGFNNAPSGGGFSGGDDQPPF